MYISWAEYGQGTCTVYKQWQKLFFVVVVFTQIVIVFNKVEALMQQVAEENGLEIMSELEAVQPGTSSLRTQEGERSQKDEDQLSKRWEILLLFPYLHKRLPFIYQCIFV